MLPRLIGPMLVLSSLVAGCGMFGGPAQTERDTDATYRAEDPYHVDPKYQSGVYNPKIQEGSDSGFSVIKNLFGGGDKGGGGGGGAP